SAAFNAPVSIPQTPAAAPTPISWTAVALAIYAAVTFVFFARFLLGMFFSGRLESASEEIDDREALRLLRLRACMGGLESTPHLAKTEKLSVPATLGVLHPVILLPADWREWDQSKLDGVLAHEVSHVARRDALTQRLSLIHRAIFWFSPLAWWMDRQLTELAEEASDEAALAGGADQACYAETLLGFFAELEAAPGRIHWEGVSMAKGIRSAKGCRAERRVERILAWKGALSMRKSLLAVIVALALPLVFLAASAQPSVARAQGNTKDTAKNKLQSGGPVAPALPAAPKAPGVVAPANMGTPPTPAAAPAVAGVVVPPMPPAPAASLAPAAPSPSPAQASYNPGPTPPAPMAAISAVDAQQRQYSYGYGWSNDGPRYVIMTGNSDAVTMSGSQEDIAHARELRKKISGDFIWFERDEKSYIITDPEFIAKAKALFAPEEALGKQQEELGRQQEALGKQQDALGAQMEDVKVKIRDITPDLERVRAELKEFQANGATQRELGRIQSEIGQLQRRIGRFQSDAGVQQSAIGRQQGELGRQQGELGRRQGELGRQQGEIARKASRELRGMFDDAIAKGVAKPE
ncbi:MAG TPA: M56 family metallopeptidase, partial [Candidatus Dormibacteraeota bacterium]|nr:M56 family metallopeptidase [Candidatus Dormibacteraeota bacterium]